MIAGAPDPMLPIECLRCPWAGTLAEADAPPDSLARCPDCGSIVVRGDGAPRRQTSEANP